MSEFEHKALDINEITKVAFIAMSKKLFYFRRHAVLHVLKQGYTPISQYGIFDFWLLDTINRDTIRRGNNTLLNKADELWVFGPISDGVLAEIKLIKDKKPIKYFRIINDTDIEEIPKNEVEFEEGLKKFASEL